MMIILINVYPESSQRLLPRSSLGVWRHAKLWNYVHDNQFESGIMLNTARGQRPCGNALLLRVGRYREIIQCRSVVEVQ